MQRPEVDGVPGMNWWQEMRLYFTRRAEGLPERPGDEPLRRILSGERSPFPELDRAVLNEYAAWVRDCSVRS